VLGICAVRVKNHYDHFQFPPLAHTESRCPVWWLRTEKSTPPLNKPDVILYALEQAGRYSLRPRSNCPISVKSDHGQSDYCQPSPSVLHSIGC
jgi:hypothetical protein